MMKGCWSCLLIFFAISAPPALAKSIPAQAVATERSYEAISTVPSKSVLPLSELESLPKLTAEPTNEERAITSVPYSATELDSKRSSEDCNPQPEVPTSQPELVLMQTSSTASAQSLRLPLARTTVNSSNTELATTRPGQTKAAIRDTTFPQPLSTNQESTPISRRAADLLIPARSQLPTPRLIILDPNDARIPLAWQQRNRIIFHIGETQGRQIERTWLNVGVSLGDRTKVFVAVGHNDGSVGVFYESGRGDQRGGIRGGINF